MSIIFLGTIVLVLVIVIVLMGAAVYFATNKKKKRMNSNSVLRPQQKDNSTVISVCPNCKEPLGDGMSFCMNCGTKIQ